MYTVMDCPTQMAFKSLQVEFQNILKWMKPLAGCNEWKKNTKKAETLWYAVETMTTKVKYMWSAAERTDTSSTRQTGPLYRNKSLSQPGFLEPLSPI